MAVHSNYAGRITHAGREDCPDNVFIVGEIDFSFFPHFTASLWYKKFGQTNTLYKKKKKIDLGSGFVDGFVVF